MGKYKATDYELRLEGIIIDLHARVLILEEMNRLNISDEEYDLMYQKASSVSGSAILSNLYPSDPNFKSPNPKK